MKALERLRHHVTGAIERGEAQAIVCQPVLYRQPATGTVRPLEAWLAEYAATPGPKEPLDRWLSWLVLA